MQRHPFRLQLAHVQCRPPGPSCSEGASACRKRQGHWWNYTRAACDPEIMRWLRVLQLRKSRAVREHTDCARCGMRARFAGSTLCYPCRYLERKWSRHHPSHRLVAFLRDGGRCVYCGRAQAWHVKESWELDHVMPRSRAAPDIKGRIENKAVACRPCNLRKGSQLPGLWPRIVPLPVDSPDS